MLNKKGILTLLFLVSLGVCFGQSKRTPYKMHALLDLPIVGVSGLGVGATRYLRLDIEPLSSSEIAGLSTQGISRFNLSATERWSPVSSTASRIGMFAAIASPTLLFISPELDRRELGPVLLLSAEAIFLTDFVVNLTQTLTLSPRPYLYNQNITLPEDILNNREHRFSNFAERTAFSAAMTFTTASMFADYHPKSKAKPYVWAAAVIVPATVGYLEYHSGRAFPTEVITGYVVGTGIGLLLPYLHKKAKNWFK